MAPPHPPRRSAPGGGTGRRAAGGGAAPADRPRSSAARGSGGGIDRPVGAFHRGGPADPAGRLRCPNLPRLDGFRHLGRSITRGCRTTAGQSGPGDESPGREHRSQGAAAASAFGLVSAEAFGPWSRRRRPPSSWSAGPMPTTSGFPSGTNLTLLPHRGRHRRIRPGGGRAVKSWE